MSRPGPLALAAAVSIAIAGCAGTPGPDTCRIEVLGIESTNLGPGVADLGYHVRGYAGSPGRVWLAARRGPGDYLSGPGIEVGPGAFEAIVELKLTNLPRAYVAVLEVGLERCSDDAPLP